MTSYDLSRAFFDWSFENPEKVSPNHTAIYFFAIEHCNRLGWKDKFGFPTQMAMEAIGIKKHQTYIKYFTDLVEWGFIKMVEKSKNQYSANIISLQSAMPKNGKALDKALIKHGAKQTESMGQSTGQSNRPIDKQLTIDNKQRTIELPFSSKDFLEVWSVLITQPKWKKKSSDALKASLKILEKHKEHIAIGMMQKSIASGWQGLFEMSDKESAELEKQHIRKQIELRDSKDENKF